MPRIDRILATAWSALSFNIGFLFDVYCPFPLLG